MFDWGIPGATVGATLAVALTALLRRTPPPRWALLLPGVCFAALAFDQLRWWGHRGVAGYVDEGALLVMELLLLLAVGWAGAPGAIAPAVVLRPGDPTRPTPGRALGVLAVAALTSVPSVLTSAPTGLFLVFPTGVALLALRSSPNLDRARHDAAVVQLWAGVAGLAGLIGALLCLRLRSTLSPTPIPHLPNLVGLFVLPLCPLGLAAVGFAHTGRPSRRALAAAAAPIALVAALVGVEAYTVRLPLRALDDLDVALAAGRGLLPLPVDACFVRLGGPSCGPRTVWVGAPDDVFTHPDRISQRSYLVLQEGGRPGLLPVEPPGAWGSGAVLAIRRGAAGLEVGDPPRVGDLDLVDAAKAGCGAWTIALDPASAWTAHELGRACPGGRCAHGTPGPTDLRCGWDDTVGWVTACPGGATCRIAAGGTARCEGTGCTLEGGGDPAGPETRLLCPGGGCTLIAGGAPVAVACPGRCTLDADPAKVTCLEGDCSVP